MVSGDTAFKEPKGALVAMSGLGLVALVSSDDAKGPECGYELQMVCAEPALLDLVVITADEIRGLTAGLLASHHPALGHFSFVEWLDEHGSTLGDAYANELDRHFH